jgi:hypothetical protein
LGAHVSSHFTVWYLLGVYIYISRRLGLISP